MKPPIKLKLSTASSGIPDSPESLFRDLKNRQPHIQHLWAHQADILRSYHGLHTREDLALELPTGTGKTLVGLLISEWRRLTFRERVAYLCPTRQLARQVGARAAEYGLKASVLVGKQVQYPLAEFAAYESAAAIAITTYSGLFNTNPRIHDPQTVILDDAHAGENYISKLWSVTISRKDQPSLYRSLVNAFSDVLPQSQYATFQDDQASFEDRDTVELLPGPHLIERRQTVEAALNKHTAEDDVYYGWKVLNGHLEACSVFFSWAEILIRPWVPPTATHAPFASANQRVYMSATLGAAGELERIAGILSITRIAAPAGWEKQSTGRRLFLMPDRSFTSNEYMPWLLQFISEQNRSLILSSSGTAAGAIRKVDQGSRNFAADFARGRYRGYPRHLHAKTLRDSLTERTLRWHRLAWRCMSRHHSVWVAILGKPAGGVPLVPPGALESLARQSAHADHPGRRTMHPSCNRLRRRGTCRAETPSPDFSSDRLPEGGR
jgi:hypothetical protein